MAGKITLQELVSSLGSLITSHASRHAPGGIDSVDAHYCTVSAAATLAVDVTANTKAILMMKRSLSMGGMV